MTDKRKKSIFYRLVALLFFGVEMGVILYIMGSFAYWNFNPRVWSKTFRIAQIIAFGVIMIIGIKSVFKDSMDKGETK